MSHLSTTIEGMGGNVSVDGGTGIVVTQSGISTLLISMNRIESLEVTLSNGSTTNISHSALMYPPIISGWTVVDDWGNAKLVANFTSSANADTGQTATLYADAAVTGGWLELDGNGDYATFPDSDNYNLGTTDFTIEFDVQFDTTSGQQHIVNHASGEVYEFAFVRNGTTLLVHGGSGGNNRNVLNDEAIGTVGAGTTYQVAMTRSGSTFNLYLNGTRTAQITSSSSLNSPSGLVTFGRPQSIATEYLDGRIRRFRMTVGTALYTGASYTPPSANFSPESTVGTILAVGVDYSAQTGASGTTITNISGSTLTDAKFVIYGA